MAYYVYIILDLIMILSLHWRYGVFPDGRKNCDQCAECSQAGWKPYDGSRNRNRYWLVENILNKEYEEVRHFIYQYNMNGLDRMSQG
jgi:hypothetical protein